MDEDLTILSMIQICTGFYHLFPQIVGLLLELYSQPFVLVTRMRSHLLTLPYNVVF
jgi:hypothetical protein